MKNRWNLTVARGMQVTAHLPRGGTVSGTVTRLSQMPGYGWRAEIDNGYTVSVDDIITAVKTIPVVIRTDADGTPVLYFVNHDATRYWLECYAHIGQHSEPSRAYMVSRPIMRPDALTPDAVALLKEWNSQPGDVTGIASVRLTYPRLRYAGK